MYVKRKGASNFWSRYKYCTTTLAKLHIIATKTIKTNPNAYDEMLNTPMIYSTDRKRKTESGCVAFNFFSSFVSCLAMTTQENVHSLPPNTGISLS
mmetsp:Transcript_7515/g.18421  ORF Transcript_7515/g.18421 Transcript_7515/m.18421 type:complete len:96 (+) Transcript_7515:1231-1518(+)